MAVNDFNNGLITGLSLQGVIFKGGGFNDAIITAIENVVTELRVKYNDDIKWTKFYYTELGEGVIEYFCVINGYKIILTPTTPIYSDYVEEVI